MVVRRTHGFTVIEVFLVITLLAIVVGLMVVPARRIAEAMAVRPTEAVLLAAVHDAHTRARQSNMTLLLSCLSETNALQLHTRDGMLLQSTPLGSPREDDDPLLRFYRLRPEDPERDDDAFEAEAEPAAFIAFQPSGASTPFAADVRDGAGLIRLVLDPFSGEPVRREEDR